MTSTAATVLDQLEQLLQSSAMSDEPDDQFDAASAAELIEVLVRAGAVQRRLDAVITTATGRVLDRDLQPREARVSERAGCRDATELLRRALRTDTAAARRYVAGAQATHREMELSSGTALPARYEQLGRALREGDLSIAGLLACTAPLDRVATRLSVADRDDADAVLAQAARGLDLAAEDGRAGPPPTTDELGALAQRIVLLLDPDGQEPEDARAHRRRGLTLGRLRDGTVPVSGALLPEVAGQLQRLLDSLLSPKADPVARPDAGADAESDAVADAMAPGLDRADDGSGGDGELPDPVDPRSPAQMRHDALASILTAAAATGGFPLLGGAAPTLVVSISAEGFASGAERASIEGTGWDVPASVARHTACAGGVQRVLFDERGAIVGLGTTARIFTALQRRAIILRDRECVIPGCHVTANWCELHHVREYADGGPTHTDNGVALCWHHHRTLDTSGWEIRMQRGVPEIRGPAWWDAHRQWRRPRIRAGTEQALSAALSRGAGVRFR
ncbi:HNH endonuclease signature motif containing protein [Microbacterium sp. USHLN186]|uniref:HNH endonuclease signature motif containing protein n=1 Tax=Microbacterium sp. USHLN186 TaxID=3081286 RepID=UPI0030179BFC